MINLVDFDLLIRDQMENIRLKTNNHYINAKTFTSGYIWGTPMGIQIHMEDDMYAVKNPCHGPKTWNFPVGAEKAKIDYLNKLIGIDGLKLRLLTKDDVNFLNEHFQGMFSFEEAIDESEYVYDAVEHADMLGKRFNRLRRLLNKFNREHETRTVMLAENDMPIAESIMMSWASEHKVRGELDTSGVEIDRFLIDHYDELGLVGTLTYIDGIPSAIAIGYPIAQDMCDIAEIKYIPTIEHLGYVTAEEFMKVFRNEYRYFNNEEDMGIPGLREYKQCLKPSWMNIFWNAYLEGNK